MNSKSLFILLVVAIVSQALICEAYAQKLPHSCARPDQVAIKHLHLDLKVDFEKKQLIGSAKLNLDRKDGAGELRLDTSGLAISKIQAGETELKWELGEHVSPLGQALTIQLPDAGDQVTIHYSSSPGAEAVQWLSPEQTTDKKHPFLFTQSQACLLYTSPSPRDRG